MNERTAKLTDVVNKLLKTNNELESEILLRKKAEIAFIESQHELKVSLEKEKELNDLKSKFVTLASHEFRTPLSTILSSANLIEKYKKEIEQENRERHVKKIAQSVHILNNILNDFLSLGKLEEGKIGFETSQFSLNELIADVAEQFEGMLKVGQEIALKADKEIELINDKNMTRNVLINLVSNAIKYSNEKTTIEISLQEVFNNKIQIAVTDSGIGIPESEQKYIFSRFFRANNAHSYQGTGLGLHLVKSYAETMKGNVNFESKEGVGTTFTVILPLKYQS